MIISYPSKEFTTLLKGYVKEGEYQDKQGTKDKKTFYRFKDPKNTAFPVQIEIFARNEEGLDLFEDQHIIPIKHDDETGYLSAILLEDEYFYLIRDNKTTLGGNPICTELAVMALKARAFNEMTKRKDDPKHIKKHRNDILKLVSRLSPNARCTLSGLPAKHMEDFLEELSKANQDDITNVLKGFTITDIKKLKQILQDCFL